MRFALVTAFALVAAVSAQSLSDLPKCASDCSVAAIPGSVCGTITNVTCVCTNTDFQDAVSTCLDANCTAEEKQQAVAFQGVVCGAGSGSATGGPSETGAPTGSNSAGVPTGSSAPSGTKSTGAPSATSTPPGDAATRVGAGLGALLLAAAGLTLL